MRIILISLLLLNLVQCRHYFIKDSDKYNLSQEEEKLLKNKKFGIIGFHPFYVVGAKYYGGIPFGSQYCCENSDPQTLNNKLLRMLQFIYEKNDAEDIKINPNYFVSGAGKYRSELKLSSNNTANQFLKFINKPDKNTKLDTNISENNLRNFLKTYIDQVQHLGHKEILNIIDVSDKNKIRLKENDFDYWLIGYHAPITSDSYAKSIVSFFPFMFSLGIIPFWSDEKIHSSIWLLDKNLLLIKKFEFNNEYTFFAASWVLWQDATTDLLFKADIWPENVYEPDLKEFSKELAKLIKESK